MRIFIRGCCAEQGSSRSGVLGEVTVNLGEFASYSAPQQRALPLRNCTTGTVLHVSLAHSVYLEHMAMSDITISPTLEVIPRFTLARQFTNMYSTWPAISTYLLTCTP